MFRLMFLVMFLLIGVGQVTADFTIIECQAIKLSDLVAICDIDKDNFEAGYEAGRKQGYRDRAEEKAVDFIPLFSYQSFYPCICVNCQGKLRFEQIPCSRPGCLVEHGRWLCPACDK